MSTARQSSASGSSSSSSGSASGASVYIPIVESTLKAATPVFAGLRTGDKHRNQFKETMVKIIHSSSILPPMYYIQLALDLENHFQEKTSPVLNESVLVTLLEKIAFKILIMVNPTPSDSAEVTQEKMAWVCDGASNQFIIDCPRLCNLSLGGITFYDSWNQSKNEATTKAETSKKVAAKTAVPSPVTATASSSLATGSSSSSSSSTTQEGKRVADEGKEEKKEEKAVTRIPHSMGSAPPSISRSATEELKSGGKREPGEGKEEKQEVKFIPVAKRVTVNAFLDFDGTFTGEEGRLTIDSKLFKSLTTSTSGANIIFKPQEEMVRLLLEGWKLDENKKRKLREGALAHLHFLLSNENRRVCFVSRNYPEYIEAVLEAASRVERITFTPVERERLSIPRGWRTKDEAVAKDIATFGKADVTEVADDDKDDFNLMIQAVNRSDPDTILHKFNTTEFDWPRIDSEMRNVLSQLLIDPQLSIDDQIMRNITALRSVAFRRQPEDEKLEDVVAGLSGEINPLIIKITDELRKACTPTPAPTPAPAAPAVHPNRRKRARQGGAAPAAVAVAAPVVPAKTAAAIPVLTRKFEDAIATLIFFVTHPRFLKEGESSHLFFGDAVILTKDILGIITDYLVDTNSLPDFVADPAAKKRVKEYLAEINQKFTDALRAENKLELSRDAETKVFDEIAKKTLTLCAARDSRVTTHYKELSTEEMRIVKAYTQCIDEGFMGIAVTPEVFEQHLLGAFSEFNTPIKGCVRSFFGTPMSSKEIVLEPMLKSSGMISVESGGFGNMPVAMIALDRAGKGGTISTEFVQAMVCLTPSLAPYAELHNRVSSEMKNSAPKEANFEVKGEGATAIRSTAEKTRIAIRATLNTRIPLPTSYPIERKPGFQTKVFVNIRMTTKWFDAIMVRDNGVAVTYQHGNHKSADGTMRHSGDVVRSACSTPGYTGDFASHATVYDISNTNPARSFNIYIVMASWNAVISSDLGATDVYIVQVPDRDAHYFAKSGAELLTSGMGWIMRQGIRPCYTLASTAPFVGTGAKAIVPLAIRYDADIREYAVVSFNLGSSVLFQANDLTNFLLMATTDLNRAMETPHFKQALMRNIKKMGRPAIAPGLIMDRYDEYVVACKNVLKGKELNPNYDKDCETHLKMGEALAPYFGVRLDLTKEDGRIRFCRYLEISMQRMFASWLKKQLIRPGVTVTLMSGAITTLFSRCKGTELAAIGENPDRAGLSATGIAIAIDTADVPNRRYRRRKPGQHGEE